MSSPLVFREKTLIHSAISHHLIYFFSMAVSIESKFVSEAERKDGFSIPSNHVFYLKPLTQIFICLRITREVVEKHLKILIGIWFMLMLKNSDDPFIRRRKALKYWIEINTGKKIQVVFTKKAKTAGKLSSPCYCTTSLLNLGTKSKRNIFFWFLAQNVSKLSN